MTKQEISEIKKLFTPKNCSITRICGCYVDGEKIKDRIKAGLSGTAGGGNVQVFRDSA